MSRRESVAPLTVPVSVSAVALEEGEEEEEEGEEEQEEGEEEQEEEEEEEEEEEWAVEEVEEEVEGGGGPSEKGWVQGRRKRGEKSEGACVNA